MGEGTRRADEGRAIDVVQFLQPGSQESHSLKMEKDLYRIFIILVWSLITINAFPAPTLQNTTSISTQELQNFTSNSKPIQKLLITALDLATKNLGYSYGSAEPTKGGMDCSGTVYYLLTKMGLKDVPRSSDSIYLWVQKYGHFYAVKNYEFSSSDFAQLSPGDLLFWSGTYAIKREINVTHVMIYLGKNKAGQPLMIGSSNGRTYKGKKVYGVSVFDFNLPNPGDKSKFLGYSCVPFLSC